MSWTPSVQLISMRLLPSPSAAWAQVGRPSAMASASARAARPIPVTGRPTTNRFPVMSASRAGVL